MTLTASIVKGLRDLRQDLFEHLETRPSSFYDKVPVGRLMTRVTNDVEALFEMLRGFGSLIGEFIPFFVALAIMFSASIKLTFILLALIPVVWVVTFIFKGATREIFREVRDSVSALNQRLQESLSGIQVVQLSVRESRNFLDYSVLNKLNRRLEFRSINISTFYGAFNDSLIAIGLGMVIWFGAEEVLSDSMTLGGVILFTRFMTMLFTPVVSLGEQLNVLFRAMASGERIFQALDWDEQIKEPESPSPLPDRLLGRIEFKDLSFSYNPGEPVLRNVSFSVAAGEKLAIVGPTGSGKSTLIRLLGRFYDFSDGSIFLDGIDLNQILSRELRRRVGVVLQDFHVFFWFDLRKYLAGKPAGYKKESPRSCSDNKRT
ncbi:MAG: ABC transporter ATP-binding protein [Candidatus Azotimanducaceae bacterium]